MRMTRRWFYPLHRVVSVGVAAALTLAPVLLSAQPQVNAAQPRPTVDGDEIAQHVCASCHGAHGNSRDARYPILAGQGAAYLHDQLRQLAAQGRRPSAGVMGAFA